MRHGLEGKCTGSLFQDPPERTKERPSLPVLLALSIDPALEIDKTCSGHALSSLFVVVLQIIF